MSAETTKQELKELAQELLKAARKAENRAIAVLNHLEELKKEV